MRPGDRNHGGYRGETIAIEPVLAEIEAAALAGGWHAEPLRVAPGCVLPGFRRGPAAPLRHIYVSSGMHGDEPAGPLAVLELLRRNAWPEAPGFWLLPCLNPGGFRTNSRFNEEGVDLNRDYRSPRTALVRAHAAWLRERPPFDLTLLLHEDWEARGFYVYELNPCGQPSLAEAIVRRASAVCPVDHSPVIEGRPAAGGIIRPGADVLNRPDWPEAFYLIHHKTPLNYTLEAPSDFPLGTRVAALVAAVEGALEEFQQTRGPG